MVENIKKKKEKKMSKGGHCNKRGSSRRHNTGKCTGHSGMQSRAYIIVSKPGEKIQGFWVQYNNNTLVGSSQMWLL